MNLQFVTGVYAMLTYLTSYLCKPEHTMSKLVKKASKEPYGKNIKNRKIENFVRSKYYPDDILKERKKKANFRKSCKNFKIVDGHLT